MKIEYKTQGTCSVQIDLDIQDGVIKHVKFHRGCDGNLGGITALVTGMKAEEAVKKLKGIQCGMKATSCPDQLAKAIESAMSQA